MLVGKRPAILRMASEAKLIDVRNAQIISGRPAMRIVAIVAAHLGFAQGMVIGHAELSDLGEVAFQASIVRGGARAENHAGLGRD